MDWVSPARHGASAAHARRQSTSPGARLPCRARSPRPSPLTRSSPDARHRRCRRSATGTKIPGKECPASRRTATPALDFLRTLSRDLLMPLAKRAIINRVKKACLGGVVRPKTPPLAFDDVAAASDRRLLQLPARRIGTEATLAVFDDLAWELPLPQEFAVFGSGISAPARHARAPLVKLHRQHQMDEIAAVRLEDV